MPFIAFVKIKNTSVLLMQLGLSNVQAQEWLGDRDDLWMLLSEYKLLLPRMNCSIKKNLCASIFQIY